MNKELWKEKTKGLFNINQWTLFWCIYDEKDKEIQKLNKDLETAIDICNQRQKEIVRLSNVLNELEKDLKTLWNVCWNNDIEMTSYQSEIFDKYYDKFHKKN